MSELSRHVPEELTSDGDVAEFEKVLTWIQRIDNAYEPGSDENVADLIVAMKADCDPNISLLLLELRRHGLQLPEMDPKQ